METGLGMEAGTVFELDTSPDLYGLYTVYQFPGLPDLSNGGFPTGALIRATDGHVYGTAAMGGPNGQGVVFRMDATGQVAVLHAFDGDAADDDSGSLPGAALLQLRVRMRMQ